MKPGIAEGIRLFNAHKYFEAHEAIEAVWLNSEGTERTLLHGLIQVAAAFHHHSRGNQAGFRSLLEKGLAKLHEARSEMPDPGLDGFLHELQLWREHLMLGAQGSASLRLPRIAGLKGSSTDE